MSDDDRWTSVIDQVLEALDDAEVSDPSTRDALAEGVRQAIESLESGIGLDVQIIGEGFPTPEDEPPVVEVVTGGRSMDAPPTSGEKPKLRLADRKDDEAEDGVTTFIATPGAVGTLLALLQAAPPVASVAAEAAYSLSVDDEGQARRVAAGAIPPLVALLAAVADSEAAENAAAALIIAGKVTTIADGAALAAEAIDSGRARDKLAALVAITTSGD